MKDKRIEIIVSEIDGIITDGFKPIDYMNHTIFKNYCERDFEAINELKSYFTFVFLSADKEVSYNIMRNRNIPTYFSENKDLDKMFFLTQRILPKYKKRPENLLYIGNHISDIPCLQLAERGITLKSSSERVRRASNIILDIEPGHGVISSLFETLKEDIVNI